MTHDTNLSLVIRALRVTHPLHPHIRPTVEEAEVADLLEELDSLHRRSKGECPGCAETWPCRGILHAEQLGLQWMGRAQARYWAHAQELWARLSQGADPVLPPLPDVDTELEPPQKIPGLLPAAAETERSRLERLRAQPVTPVRCREPDCPQVISVLHPLAADWLAHVTCDAHRGTSNDRYALAVWSRPPQERKEPA